MKRTIKLGLPGIPTLDVEYEKKGELLPICGTTGESRDKYGKDNTFSTVVIEQTDDSECRFLLSDRGPSAKTITIMAHGKDSYRQIVESFRYIADTLENQFVNQNK